ncbi:outer membrane protein [Paracoccus sp. (in: a-proteobacteria)]
MRKYAALASSLAALAAAPALAGGYVAPVADVEPVVAVTPAPIVGTWAGGYLGANVNYGKAGFDYPADAEVLADPEPDGANFALRGGYDWQRGNGVFGIGAEYNLGKYKDDVTVGGEVPVSAELEMKNVGTVFLRAGYAFSDQLMAYGLLGYTHAKLEGGGDSETVDGATLGLGTEYRFNPNWSGYAEYAYSDLGEVGDTGIDVDLSQVKLGVNFRF